MPSPSKQTAVMPFCREDERHFQSNTLELLTSKEQPPGFVAGVLTTGEGLDGEPLPCITHDKVKREVQKIEEDELQQDALSALIKGWSTFSSTFHRRDSCEFTTCVSPCVRKAVRHLIEFKDQLAVLGIEVNTWPSEGSISRKESLTTVASESRPTSCTDTKFTPDTLSPGLSSVGFSPAEDMVDPAAEYRSSCHSASQGIQVQSSLLDRPDTTQSSERANSAVSHLGYDLVEEIVRLFGRMEDDRLVTQKMLSSERKKVERLRTKIDQLAFKRLVELPVAIQTEHESCATDINELKWHCAYQGRLEARLRGRVDHAELQHSKLIGQLESSKESCPLVREKLELEDIAMASIQSKQDQTDEELQQTLKRLESTEQKTKEAKMRASQERMLIKQDVDIIRNLLNEVSDELAQYKMNYTSNVHTISDIKNTLKENAEQCVKLEKREDSAKAQDAVQNEKVVKLKEKIVEQSAEHVRLNEENEKLKKDNQVMEAEYQASITKLKIEIKQCEIQVREMSRKNKAMREDMDTIVKLTEKCKKQRTSEKKALVRAGQEVEKVKQHIEMMNEEAKKLRTLNHSLKSGKACEEENYFTEEDSLRSAEHSLRNQLKEESHTRTVLQARIATDTSDLLRSRIDSKKKKTKMSEQALEADKVLSWIRQQVSSLEKVHQEREQTVTQISEVLDKLKKQWLQVESKYRTKIETLRPKEQHGQKERLELQQRIDHIQWRSNMMSKKMKDMSSSTVMMAKIVNSTGEDIAELEEDNKEAKLCLEANNEAKVSLKQALDATEERLSCRKVEHLSHLDCRKSVFQQTMTALDEKLIENKSVAGKYQKLYSQFLKMKDLFFKKFESLINEENHLKQQKELHTLQNHLSECLQHYYSLRGLSHKYHVAQFKVNSKENSEKLYGLQQDLSDIVTHIDNFLRSTYDAHASISTEA